MPIIHPHTFSWYECEQCGAIIDQINMDDLRRCPECGSGELTDLNDDAVCCGEKVVRVNDYTTYCAVCGETYTG